MYRSPSMNVITKPTLFCNILLFVFFCLAKIQFEYVMKECARIHNNDGTGAMVTLRFFVVAFVISTFVSATDADSDDGIAGSDGVSAVAAVPALGCY